MASAAKLKAILEAPKLALKGDYIPKGPSVSLNKALRNSAKRRPKPQTCSAHAAHFQPRKLQNNIFARLLAARPKMDAQTRLVVPGSLLTKIKFNKEVAPVSSRQTDLLGPRLYLSALAKTIPPGLVGKRNHTLPELKGLPIESDFGEAQRKVMIEDIRTLAAQYNPTGDTIICRVTFLCPSATKAAKDAKQGKTRGEAGPRVEDGVVQLQMQDIGVAVPEVIYANKSGTQLAGALYKYCYVEARRHGSP